MLRAEVQLAGKTQAGHRHQVEGLDNEDAVFVTDEHPLFDAVLMVADGMGGHPRPREASQAAVTAARETLWDLKGLQTLGDVSQVLLEALSRSHRAVCALRTNAPKPPGTTLSLCVIASGQLHIAHVGDGSVYLFRDGQARTVAGGEDRRAGNRPAQFLGQTVPLEPELRRLPLAAGDRLLLCTDGLTRYFGETGTGALEQVLARKGVAMPAIASQLTAHSRSDEYDDDTTVALAEVTALTDAPRRQHPGDRSGATPRPRPTQEEAKVTTATAGSATGAGAGAPGSMALAVLVGAVLLASGFSGGYFFGRQHSAALPGSTGTSSSTGSGPVLVPDEPASLPTGNLILLDPLGGRVFSLSTRNGTVPGEPVTLQALRVGTSGRLTQAGQFQLDPAKSQLTDAEGRTYPVEIHGSQVRILRGGTLAVATRPAGAVVSVDGREMGPAPQKLRIAAGRHHVAVAGRNWASESDVEVLPGRTVTLTLGTP